MDILQKRKVLYDFMDWKDDMLSKTSIISRHEYFNNEDKIALKNFTNEGIDKSYKIIQKYKKDADHYLCPFCIIFNNNGSDNECIKCTYHDYCNIDEENETSTYRKIGSILDKIGGDLILNYINQYFK